MSSINPQQPPVSIPTSGGAASAGISRADYVSRVADIISKSKDLIFQKTQIERIKPHIFASLSKAEDIDETTLKAICVTLTSGTFGSLSEEQAIQLVKLIEKKAASCDQKSLTEALSEIVRQFYDNGGSGEFDDPLSRYVEHAAFIIASKSTDFIPDLQHNQTLNLHLIEKKLQTSCPLTKDEVTKFKEEVFSIIKQRTKLPASFAIKLAAIAKKLTENEADNRFDKLIANVQTARGTELGTQVAKYIATIPTATAPAPAIAASSSSSIIPPLGAAYPILQVVAPVGAASPPAADLAAALSVSATDELRRRFNELQLEKKSLIASFLDSHDFFAISRERLAEIQVAQTSIITQIGTQKFGTMSQYTQEVESFRAGATNRGNFARHSCAFNSIVNLESCFINGPQSINLDQNLIDGYTRHKTSLSAPCQTDYPNTQNVDDAIEKSRILARLGDGFFSSDQETMLNQGQESQFFQERLQEGINLLGTLPNLGMVICNKQEFYSVFIKKNGDTDYEFTIMDSHGLVESDSSTGGHRIRPGANPKFQNAYAITFDNIEDASNFLAIKSPYREPAGDEDTSNQVEITYIQSATNIL
jgi:hypothetical protein